MDSITYENIELRKIKIGESSFGLRQIGKGEDLVFIHGFPTHGYTWRKLIPTLSENYKCTILDLPGLGDSEWSARTNFNILSQAKSTLRLLDKLEFKKVNLIAHDSGGTIARIIAINEPNRVRNLILINTEIPNHRPPFIELYQKISLLPLASYYFRNKLNKKLFVKSSMGFKYAYSDKNMLNDEHNLGPYLQPLINSNKKTKGAFSYLKGIDWKIIDEFAQTHKKIKANVLLIWGEGDKTFPIKLAKDMVSQFESKIEFKSINNASLLPHEEKPQEVCVEIIRHFENISNNIDPTVA